MDSIETASRTEQAVLRLQTLLFLIDRHWPTVVEVSLAEAVLKCLIACLHQGDPAIQTWAFLCLGAVAAQPDGASLAGVSALRSTFASPSRRAATADSPSWDQAWNFSVRRITFPNVCRAASHLGHLIVVFGKASPATILNDVETFTKDIEVQGPSFPFDSVCDFLSVTLELASRDVRLFRLELEDKVFSWVASGGWRPVEGTTKGFNIRTKLESHQPNDVLRLFASLCRLPHRINLISRDLPPDCAMTSYLADEAESAVARDYIVYARILPPAASSSLPAPQPSDILSISEDLRETSGVARKASTFLQNAADALSAEWGSPLVAASFTAEKVRRSIDVAVLALAFEGVLQLNGISSNRKSIKAACTLLKTITPAFSLPALLPLETVVLLQGLEPLFLQRSDEGRPLERVTVPAGPRTGMRSDLLPRIDRASEVARETQRRLCALVQAKIWQSADVRLLISALARDDPR